MAQLEAAFAGRITARMPAGWFGKESITLIAPDGQGNVIASSEPLDGSIDTARYADVQGGLLRSEFPGFHQFSLEEVELYGDRRGLLRFFTWTPPDGVPVMQMQSYYAEAGRGYTATATSPGTTWERFEEVFRQMLSELRLLG
ncbi:MAG: DcrB-related protein [Pseudolysinimonas sp.]